MHSALYIAIIKSDVDKVTSILNDPEVDISLNEIFTTTGILQVIRNNGKLSLELTQAWLPLEYTTTYLQSAFQALAVWNNQASKMHYTAMKDEVEAIINQHINTIKLLVIKGARLASDEPLSLFYAPLFAYNNTAFTVEQMMDLTEFLLQNTRCKLALSRPEYGVPILKRLQINESIDLTVRYFQLLLTYGLDVNAQFGMGLTPLMFALILNHPGLVKMMLNRGGDISAKIDMNMYAQALNASVSESIPLSVPDLAPKFGPVRLLIEGESRLKNSGVSVASIMRYTLTQYYHHLHQSSAEEFRWYDNVGISNTLKEPLIMREPEFEARSEDAGTDIAVSHYLAENGLISNFVDLIQAYRSHEHPGLAILSELKQGLFFQLKGPIVDKSISKEQLKAERKAQLKVL